MEEKEKELHKSLHPDVERVVENKKLLLMGRMLSDLKYDDMEVIDLLTMGTKIVGTNARTRIWKESQEKAQKCRGGVLRHVAYPPPPTEAQWHARFARSAR